MSTPEMSEHHTLHPVGGDPTRDVVLQLLGHAVVQLALEGHQQDVAQGEHRDLGRLAGNGLVHRALAPASERDTSMPCLPSA